MGGRGGSAAPGGRPVPDPPAGDSTKVPVFGSNLGMAVLAFVAAGGLSTTGTSACPSRMQKRASGP